MPEAQGKGGIRYKLVPGKFGANAVDAATAAPPGMEALVRRMIEQGRTEIVKRTPVGWSGQLRGGYQTEVRRRGTKHPIGVIANPTIYHDPAEEGRKPGRQPPTDALIPWVASKLGVPPGPERRSVAFLVARSIGAHGTKGAHMVEEGWDATREKLQPELKALGLRLVKVIEK
jgi:hypothetical protein